MRVIVKVINFGIKIFQKYLFGAECMLHDFRVL